MIACPRCKSANIHPRGSASRPGRYQCEQCHQYFTDKGSPRVLVMDIETLPIIGTFWDTGRQYISPENILEDWVVLSWSAKGLFDPNIIGDILTPEEIARRNATVLALNPKPHNADYRIIKRMWDLLDRADVVIHQNGKKFDIKKLNARFIYYGFPPYRPIHQIDTLEAHNAAFGTSSGKLAYMTKFLSLPRKMDTNYELWLRCTLGDPAALKEMYGYGLNDTWILEDYYARIRAWIPKHPSFSAYTHNYVDLEKGEVACHVCRHVIPEGAITDTYKTPLGYEYDSFRCPHCGAVGRRTQRRPGQKIQTQGVR